MNYDFLREYTIPHTDGATQSDPNLEAQQLYYNQPPPPPPPFPDTPAPFINLNRYIPPKFHGTNYKPPVKRKYNGGPNAPKVSTIVETTRDGRPVMFLGRDRSYPDELNLQIHPLRCSLCNVNINSTHSAKDHYESKAHDRNISAWLAKNFTMQGLDPPEVKRLCKKGGPTGPDAFHCDVCDLKLTSLTHASQHYAGRKHRLVASQVSKPSGAGHYDKDGKWVRTGSKLTPTVANDNRFGIGEQFGQQETSVISAPDTTTSSDGEHSVKQEVKVDVADEMHVCKTCNISVTSASQMTMHLDGTKHRKKLKQLGLEVPPKTESVPEQTLEVRVVNSILASIHDNSNEDLSMHRTPSGSYYCKICNMTMCHAAALQQHLSGKKHLRKASDEQRQRLAQKTMPLANNA